jgi:hypothetical protein
MIFPKPSPLFLFTSFAAGLIAIFVLSGIFGVNNSSQTITLGNSGSETEPGGQANLFRELELVTLLGFDAIPSIDSPRFLDIEAADGEYQSDELILGIEVDGDAHAYSVPTLSSHEIVNDVVGGKPVAITW